VALTLRSGQSRPCQVAMSTTFPSGSMSDHQAGAYRSPRIRPPASRIASTRACARSWGRETSTWIRFRGATCSYSFAYSQPVNSRRRCSTGLLLSCQDWFVEGLCRVFQPRASWAGH